MVIVHFLGGRVSPGKSAEKTHLTTISIFNICARDESGPGALQVYILSNGPIKFKDNFVMLYSVNQNSYSGFQKCPKRNDRLGRYFNKTVADSRCGQYCYYAGPTPCLMLSLIFVLSTIYVTAGSTK